MSVVFLNPPQKPVSFVRESLSLKNKNASTQADLTQKKTLLS